MQTLLLLTACASAYSQQSPVTDEVHIAVQIKQLDGDAIGRLTARDFHVSAGVQPLHVSVAQPLGNPLASPIAPTRLLVIFPPLGPQTPSNFVDRTLRELAPVWLRGWQVSVLTPAGKLTSFKSDEQALMRSVVTPASVRSTPPRAIAKLRSWTGRRVVVVVATAGHRNLDQLRRAAQGAQAMLYDAGGDQAENYVFGDLDSSAAGTPPGSIDTRSLDPEQQRYSPLNNLQFPVASARLAIADVHAERTFRGAIKDAIHDERNFYDLQVQVPSGTSSLTLAVSTHQDYRITAQTYTEAHVHAPDLLILQGTR